MKTTHLGTNPRALTPRPSPSLQWKKSPSAVALRQVSPLLAIDKVADVGLADPKPASH